MTWEDTWVMAPNVKTDTYFTQDASVRISVLKPVT